MEFFGVMLGLFIRLRDYDKESDASASSQGVDPEEYRYERAKMYCKISSGRGTFPCRVEKPVGRLERDTHFLRPSC